MYKLWRNSASKLNLHQNHNILTSEYLQPYDMLIKSVNDAHTSRTIHTSTVSYQFKSLKKSQIIWQNIMSLFSCNCKCVKSLSTIQAYRTEMSTPSMLSPIFTLGPPACPDTRTTSTARNHAMVEHGETTIQGSPPRGCWSDEMWQFNI